MDLILTDREELDALGENVAETHENGVGALHFMATLDVDGRGQVIGVGENELDGTGTLGTLPGSVETTEHELVAGVNVGNGTRNDDGVGRAGVETK